MKLHTVFITYNRLELTKRAIASYFDTIGDMPYTIHVVDNASTDGTVEWLKDAFEARVIDGYIAAKENRYPGWACNRGFEIAPDDATHLHRADNDFIFLPGWTEEVERRFGHIRRLGQLGLRTNAEEGGVQTNTGGNCVVARKMWDRGIRWDERPWPQIRDEVGPGWTEDSLFSQEVRRRGWNWTRAQRPCIQPISSESLDDPYYQQTWADRGIVNH